MDMNLSLPITDMTFISIALERELDVQAERLVRYKEEREKNPLGYSQKLEQMIVIWNAWKQIEEKQHEYFNRVSLT